MKEHAHILIVDDEKNYLLVLQTLLEDEGYTVTALNDPEIALTFLGESEVDVVVTDMKMPKISGQELLQRIKKSWPQLPVLIMTAFGSIESAVEVMKYGAFDYITKPFANDELLLSINNAVELSYTHQQYHLLQQELENRFGIHQLIGRSRAIRDCMSMVERCAPRKSTVLLYGEPGTGKELVARAIHYASPRKDNPFVGVNCHGLNGEQLERELFGLENNTDSGAVALQRGRIEQADGGTLFLDEVEALSLEVQMKLANVLQEGCFERVGGGERINVDVRVVCASCVDLAKLVEEGGFLGEFYYRLNVVQLYLPPLRNRREDIPLLVAHFAEKVREENKMPQKSFSPTAMNYLTGYEWPGNIRQLKNVVERCLVLVPHAVIEAEHLPAEIRGEESQYTSAADLLPFPLDLADTLQKIEAALIRRALVKSEFVQVKAAESLAISKSLLQYKLKKYRITGH